ncbi:MAG: DUF433 domain-containing protein [Candidatus Eisenbacteria bacterium]|uniref:DUF433 domain-containing protein n=1 Tax=Eiseniibacteriota bacterium TaxID=2212470 RepID=A0A956NGM0_UNCEI|nr:DUF433 domain-containing protein [Candidatus Eisenbacteria bacterium]
MIQIAPHVVVDDEILAGKPIVQGTRIPVSLVVGQIASDESMETVMEEYALTREQVLAALAYAATVVEE